MNDSTWNPAKISRDIMEIAGGNYSIIDKWTPSELNEVLRVFRMPVVDTWNPAELDEARRRIVEYISSSKTFSGNPITFNVYGNLTPGVNEAMVSFTPKQTGTPSPEDPKPITGYSELNLYQSDGSTTTPDETYAASLGDTYFGGTYDFTTGKLTVNTGYVDLGSLNWYLGGGGAFFDTDVQNTPPESVNAICDSYPVNTVDYYYNNPSVVGIAVSGTSKFRLYNSSYTTGEEVQTALSGVYLAYELATPLEVDLTEATIDLNKGINVFWTDADILTLSFSFTN